jgi:hypothetical protein
MSISRIAEFNILLRDLAWPATVLVVTFLFRAEFRRTLSRLSTLRYRDFEASFERGLREAEVMVKPQGHAAPRSSRPGDGDEAPLPKHLDPDRLLRVADLSPTAAINEAWHDVEQAALAAGEALGVPARAGETASGHTLHALVDQGLLTSHTLVAFERLRRLHQQAAHHPDLRFSSNQAHRYVDLAHKLVARLHAVTGRATSAALAG